MRASKVALPFLFAASFIAGPAAPAAAESILFNTFGPGNAFNQLSGTFFGFEFGEEDSPDTRFARAMTFVPVRTGTLAAVELPLIAPCCDPGEGNVVVNLFAAEGDLPGQLIESFSMPQPIDLSIVMFSSVQKPLLQAGVTYFLETTTTGTANGTWFAAPDGVGPAFMRDIYRINNGPWREGAGTITAAFRLTSDAAPVPEPASIVLLGTGLAAAAWRRARRRPQRSASPQ